MSTLRPTVCFHSRPAFAIFCKSLSPLVEDVSSVFLVGALELTALSMDGEGPEKKAWILYISLYDCERGM